MWLWPLRPRTHILAKPPHLWPLPAPLLSPLPPSPPRCPRPHPWPPLFPSNPLASPLSVPSCLCAWRPWSGRWTRARGRWSAWRESAGRSWGTWRSSRSSRKRCTPKSQLLRLNWSRTWVIVQRNTVDSLFPLQRKAWHRLTIPMRPLHTRGQSIETSWTRARVCRAAAFLEVERPDFVFRFVLSGARPSTPIEQPWAPPLWAPRTRRASTTPTSPRATRRPATAERGMNKKMRFIPPVQTLFNQRGTQGVNSSAAWRTLLPCTTNLPCSWSLVLFLVQRSNRDRLSG